MVPDCAVVEEGGRVQQGIAHYQAGDFAAAIEAWLEALSTISHPLNRAAVLNNLALAYQKIGQFDQAIDR